MKNLFSKNLIFVLLCSVMTHGSFANDPGPIVNDVDEELRCLRPAAAWDHMNAMDLGVMTIDELNRLDRLNRGRLSVALIARDAKRDVSEIKLRESQGMSLVDRANSPEYLARIEECRRIRATGSNRGSAIETQNGQAQRSRCLRRAFDDLIKPFYPKTGRRMDFFHVGIAVKVQRVIDGQRVQTWEMFHELKPCNSEMPNVYHEGMSKFFLDEPQRFRSLILLPTIQIQRRIHEVLFADPAEDGVGTLGIDGMLSNRYNAIANAFQDRQQQKDQNSNQWVLEVVAAAQNSRGVVRNRADAQNFLRSRGYLPTVIRISSAIPGPSITDGLVRLIAEPFIGSVSTNNHPFVDRDMVELVSVDSIEDYLIRQNALMELNPSASGAARFKKELILPRRWTEQNFAPESRRNGGHGGRRRN